MLWGYVQLDDGTQFAYSETREDGTVRVAVERPTESKESLPRRSWLQGATNAIKITLAEKTPSIALIGGASILAYKPQFRFNAVKAQGQRERRVPHTCQNCRQPLDSHVLVAYVGRKRVMYTCYRK